MRLHCSGNRCLIRRRKAGGAGVLGLRTTSLVLALVLVSPQNASAQIDDSSRRSVKIGVVSPAASSTNVRAFNAFWERLRELGYREGQNLVVELRWADGHNDRLPALINDVLGRNIDVLVTFGTPATMAASSATSRIPIVAAIMGDPVGLGLTSSLARPGGNVTGMSAGYDERFISKWLEFVKETVPRLATATVIRHPGNPSTRRLAEGLRRAAPTLGVKVRIVDVRESSDFERAFQEASAHSQGVIVLPDPLVRTHQHKIISLAAQHRLASIYPFPDFVDAGGLMAYGPDVVVLFRRAAEYVEKILTGTKPSELPVEEPTRFVLTVNLKTAKALGLTVPESILLRADEVIR